MTRRQIRRQHELSAVPLSGGRWAVRPHRQLGTLGMYPEPWVMQVVHAQFEEEAITRAERLGGVFGTPAAKRMVASLPSLRL